MIFSNKKSTIVTNLFFALLFSVVSSYSPLVATIDQGSSDASIEALLEKLADKGNFSGSVLVMRNKKPVLRKAYGVSDLKRSQDDHTEMSFILSPNTAFLIGSLTKSFTANIILQLAQEGKLSLDTPAFSFVINCDAQYFMDPALMYKHTGIDWSTTIEDLLTHTDETWGNFEHEDYTSTSNGLLARIIAVVDECSYEESLQKRIFDKLGMHHSFASDDAYWQARTNYYKNSKPNQKNTFPLLALIPCSGKDYMPCSGQGYWMDEGQAYYRTSPQTSYAYESIISTVDDLYLWAQAVKQGTLLTPAYDAIFKTSCTNYDCNHGKKYHRSNYLPEKCCHDGLIAHFTSKKAGTTQDADDEVVMIFLSNTGTIPHVVEEILAAAGVFGCGIELKTVIEDPMFLFGTITLS